MSLQPCFCLWLSSSPPLNQTIIWLWFGCYAFLCLRVHVYMYLSVCPPSIPLSVCLSLSLSVCVCLCLSRGCLQVAYSSAWRGNALTSLLLDRLSCTVICDCLTSGQSHGRRRQRCSDCRYGLTNVYIPVYRWHVHCLQHWLLWRQGSLWSLKRSKEKSNTLLSLGFCDKIIYRFRSELVLGLLGLVVHRPTGYLLIIYSFYCK